ncbi:hypothetical protein Bbelb_151910 [Branchiostoma belcheri]|nr:hypothetical protein Bbelb_151910 [Branchiostoma belcheri]
MVWDMVPNTGQPVLRVDQSVSYECIVNEPEVTESRAIWGSLPNPVPKVSRNVSIDGTSCVRQLVCEEDNSCKDKQTFMIFGRLVMTNTRSPAVPCKSHFIQEQLTVLWTLPLELTPPTTTTAAQSQNF